jgi:saccharopine dehydrogenase-like NADP-dependent oxidoreductase
MAVYVTNLVVNAGVDFDQIFNLENSNTNSVLNLTGYSVKAQMRKHAAATGVTTFTSSIYNASSGKIKIGLSTALTSSLKPGRYVYDVVLTDPNNFMSRVVEGMVLVREGVTR